MKCLERASEKKQLKISSKILHSALCLKTATMHLYISARIGIVPVPRVSEMLLQDQRPQQAFTKEIPSCEE